MVWMRCLIRVFAIDIETCPHRHILDGLDAQSTRPQPSRTRSGLTRSVSI